MNLVPRVYYSEYTYDTDSGSRTEAILDGISGWELYHCGYLSRDRLHFGLIQIGRHLSVIPTYLSLNQLWLEETKTDPNLKLSILATSEDILV